MDEPPFFLTTDSEKERENTCQLFENDREGSDERKRERQRSGGDQEKNGEMRRGRLMGGGKGGKARRLKMNLSACRRANGGSDNDID